MIEPLRNFLLECPYLDDLAKVNVDFLPSDPTNYSIELVPTQDEKIETYINGSSLNRQLFHFKARLFYSEEVDNNISNIDFFDNFKAWLEEKSENDDLPILTKNRKAVKISALSPAYILNEPTASNAEYAIQCELQYLKLN